MVVRCVEGTHGVVARCRESAQRGLEWFLGVQRVCGGCTEGLRMAVRCMEGVHGVVASVQRVWKGCMKSAWRTHGRHVEGVQRMH